MRQTTLFIPEGADRYPKIHDLIISFSLANLLLIKDWSYLGGLSHSVYPVPQIVPMTIVHFFGSCSLIALALFALLYVCRMSGRRLPLVMGHLVFLGLLFFPCNFIRTISNISVQFPFISWTFCKQNLGHCAAALVLAVIALGLAAIVARYGNIVRLVRAILFVTFPFLVITHANLVWTVASTKDLEGYKTLRPWAQSTVRKEPRIIWFVFDEFDYRLTFEQRPDSVRLPELDKLKKESFFAKEAYSPTQRTHSALPSYLMGKVVTDFCRRSDNDLDFATLSNKALRPWSQSSTIIGQAKSLGLRTALIGYFHPYCRMMGKETDYCFHTSWYRYADFDGLPSKMLSMVRRAFQVSGGAPGRIDNYKDILYHTNRVLTDTNIDFVFVHWPVPHLPNIYDRKTGKFVENSQPKSHEEEKDEYFSSLVLVDKTLAIVRRELEDAGLWDTTLLIVTSDHAFHPWRWNPPGTPEEKISRRIPFFVKFPAEVNFAVTHERPFNAIIIHDLVLEVMKKRVKTMRDFTRWLDRHHQDYRLAVYQSEDRCLFVEQNIPDLVSSVARIEDKRKSLLRVAAKSPTTRENNRKISGRALLPLEAGAGY